LQVFCGELRARFANDVERQLIRRDVRVLVAVDDSVE
jgi:hypothetical protein